MAHWGWYWKVKKKHLARKICSKLPFIDSFRLYKNNVMTGYLVQPLDIRVKPMSDHLSVIYRKRKEHSYTIPVEKLPCNYGGFRYFFKCPLCEKRMRFLYFAEQSLFLCRACLNLGYNSQRLRPSRRLGEQGAKIQQLIKNKGGDVCKKPPRMHRSTWDALIERQVDYEIRAEDALRNEVNQWHGPEVLTPNKGL